LGGDIYAPGVDPDWRQRVANVEFNWDLLAYGDQFVQLTKNPYKIEPNLWNLPNQWMGVSCTDDRAYHLIEALDANCGPRVHRWVSFEPVLSQVHSADEWHDMADWLHQFRVEFVVLGGLSDGEGRIVPPNEPGGLRASWAQPIIDAAWTTGAKLFCKNLSGQVWRTLVNPCTGKPMQGPHELREIPDAWLALRR